MSIWTRLFPNRKPDLSFEDQVNNEIYNCEQAIFSYQKDIHNIRKLAADLIHQTLVVKESYWYEELSYLDEIFKLSENKKIDENVLLDIRNLCESYKQQFELRQLKINICRKNRDELKKILSTEDSLRQKISSELKPENIVEKHREISKSISDIDIAIEISTKEKIKLMRDDIISLKNELTDKKEFNKQLKILYSKYGDSEDVGTVKVYLEELKKLINE
ncbi:MAG: hypothetical protein U9Q83_05480 [Bacteroidota bacterium]|nr:hypothetical protein [Bacteroidota bacterium]